MTNNTENQTSSYKMNTEKLIKDVIKHGGRPEEVSRSSESGDLKIDVDKIDEYIGNSSDHAHLLSPIYSASQSTLEKLSDDDMLDYDSVDGLQKKFDDLKTENISVNSIVAAGDTYIEVGALKSVVKEINTNKLDMQKNPMCVRYKNETVVIEW